MANGKGILIAAGAVALYFLLRGINFVNNVEFIFKKIRLGGSFFYPEAYATFTIVNPTDVSVTIDNVMGDVFFKDQPVAAVSGIDAVQVNGKQAIDIEVRMVAKITDLFTVIGNALQGNVANNIIFRGSVQANGITIPVNTTLA
jgi:hypothetical protein